MTITRQQLKQALSEARGIPQASASEILKQLWPDTDDRPLHITRRQKKGSK